MEEKNYRICKSCKKIKIRIQNGKFPNGRDKRWIDDGGKQWSGSTCPDCVKDKSKERMKAKRQKDVV